MSPTRAPTDLLALAEYVEGLAAQLEELRGALSPLRQLASPRPGFEHPVYIRDAIQSALFQAGVAGWRGRGQGTFEANDLLALLARFLETTAPATPATGQVVLYAKSDGLLYSKDDRGIESMVSEGGLPEEVPLLVDDFFFPGTEAGEVGIGWSFSNGSIINFAAPLPANHPGVFIRRTGAVAAQVASFYPGAGSSVPIFNFDQLDTLYFVVALVTTGADFRVRFGVTVNSSIETPAHGVFVERLHTDTSWFGVSRNGGLQTRTAALLAHDTNWHTFRIRRISATEVGFQVDGGTEVTISASNIPDAADELLPFIQIVPTTTTARDLEVDFMSVKLLPQAR